MTRGVLLLTNDWPSFQDGGIATLSRALRDGLVELGVDCPVWTRGGGDRAAEPGVRTVSGRWWGRFGTGHWARAIAGGVDADAIIAMSWESAAGVVRARRGGVTSTAPLAVFAHGRDVLCGLPRHRERDRASVFAVQPRWLSISRFVAERVPSAMVVRAAVPGATAVPAALAGPSPSREIVMVSRLVRRKGHDTAIAAMTALRGRQPGLRLTVVGDGPERERIRALAAPLGDAVQMTGYLDAASLESVWSRSALCILPARDEGDGDVEGYGLVALEAAARGVPSVVSRTGGLPESVGDTGIVVAPDDPAALASAIEGLLDDPARRAALGAAARTRWAASHRPAHLAASVLAALASA